MSQALRRRPRSGLNPWTGVETETLGVPRATMEALLRREVEGRSDLVMGVQRDLLTGARIVRIRARPWWLRSYRTAEVRLIASGPEETTVAARPDVRAPTRLTRISTGVGVALTGGMLLTLMVLVPSFASHFLGVGVLSVGLLAFAEWDIRRRRRGFSAQIRSILARTAQAARRVEHAPGQLSLPPDLRAGGELALGPRPDTSEPSP